MQLSCTPAQTQPPPWEVPCNRISQQRRALPSRITCWCSREPLAVDLSWLHEHESTRTPPPTSWQPFLQHLIFEEELAAKSAYFNSSQGSKLSPSQSRSPALMVLAGKMCFHGVRKGWRYDDFESLCWEWCEVWWLRWDCFTYSVTLKCAMESIEIHYYRKSEKPIPWFCSSLLSWRVYICPLQLKWHQFSLH